MKVLIKTLLRERLIGRSELDQKEIADFVNFSKDFLGITDDLKIKLFFDRTPELVTTANYSPNGVVSVYAKDRALVDILRSIAHEMVHHKQNLDGRITNIEEDGKDGSPIENEANAIAGVLIRKYGRLHPKIYI